MAHRPRANPLAFDTEVQVPEAVKRAAAAADAAMKAANPQPEPAPTPAPAANDTIQIAEPPPPTGLPERVPLQIEPAPPPPPQPSTPSNPQPGENVDEATWKNRYEAMQGRFREASAQLIQSNNRMEALENMLAAVQSAPRAPEPAPRGSLLTQKDMDDMGPEMVDFVKRAAQEVAGSQIADLQSQVQQLQAKLNGTTTVLEGDARARMHNLLDDKLPNWNDVNHDPEFHAWLALRDTMSGVTRKKLLTDAYAGNEGPRVLSIFQSFISETAALRPAAPTLDLPPAPGPQAQQPTRPTLAELAAPGRARTSAAPSAPDAKQLIRTSDINAFYAAVRKGAYAGREAEKAAHEAELNAAMREGRVVRDT